MFTVEQLYRWKRVIALPRGAASNVKRRFTISKELKNRVASKIARRVGAPLGTKKKKDRRQRKTPDDVHHTHDKKNDDVIKKYVVVRDDEKIVASTSYWV